MRTLLVVEDDLMELRAVASVLSCDYRVLTAADRDSALRLLKTSPVDVALVDIHLPDAACGLAVIQEASVSRPVICVSGCEDPSLVRRARRAGAAAYVQKPYSLAGLRKALGDTALDTATRPGTTDDAARGHTAILLGSSEQMRSIRADIARFARFDFPVMILGESGTGKDLAARELHALSRRAAEPFLALNCGAIPAALAESELFGTERGAFTGAVAKAGAWERAHGGTLFLDEVADLAPEVQGKLLRALEDGQSCRLGGGRPMHCNVRVVSATNADVRAAECGFRFDLLTRLETLILTMPPLRERPDDITPLAEHFARSLCDGKHLGDSALRALENHDWPGNVRELRNVVCRAAVCACDEPSIEAHHVRLTSTPRKKKAHSLSDHSGPSYWNRNRIKRRCVRTGRVSSQHGL